ncbi:hypothetical protein [Prosthecobacter sp.]|uniref:hypothetical protein n=1 Tax=Prosthecobacter sp. TaxID=1965333 RepID=UPI002487E113|nr:hypothetical protein [Prosthecobacter sp.]MDI1312920.1 hypothetical protein [Prosthecobacter sp.]
MIRKLLPASLHSSAPLKIFELLLALYVLFGLGTWQMYKGWQHPDYVGWSSSGAIIITGMIACICLIWRRRQTHYSATVLILFVVQLANATQDILKWSAKDEIATWPKMHCALAAAFLVLLIWDEKKRRKEAAKDAASEFKIFDMKDTL